MMPFFILSSKFERILLDKKDSKILNKREGTYISITFKDVTDYDNRDKLIEVISKELKTILLKKNVLYSSSLIVGLGNSKSTPDSLGPLTIDKVFTTRYLSELSVLGDDYSSVSKIAPSVFGDSGIESFDIIKGIVGRIKPSFIIVIDSLSSSSIDSPFK